eukprot:g15399.t1
MEACATSHYWGRLAQSHGHKVTLLHANYVRPYVRRNKTDSADADALLQAVQNPELNPVPVKSVDKQALQSLHRLREQWKAQRVALLNMVRSLLAEFGTVLPRAVGEDKLAEPVESLPELMQASVRTALDQAKHCRANIRSIDQVLAHYAEHSVPCQQLLSINCIGVTTATALVAKVSDIHQFKRGRSFSNWLGLTAREHSSGGERNLGGISKRGDVYLRMMMIHCGRVGVLHARRKVYKAVPLTALEQWIYKTEQRVGFNKAVVALANKLARIVWAVWTRETVFDGDHRLRFA